MGNTLHAKNRFSLVALALAAALAFAVSVCAVLAVSPQAHAVSAGAYVSGQKYSGGFATQSGKAIWETGLGDKAYRTITLNNAVINAGHKDTGVSDSGVYATPDFNTLGGNPTTLNIVLVGNNTINVSANARGIFNNCANVTLNIMGSGTLNIVGAGKFGIWSRGPLNISANVTVNGSEYGVYAVPALSVASGNIAVISPMYNGLTSEKADVSISGGVVNVANYDGHGIQAYGNVRITGGKVSATQLATGSPNLAVAAGASGAISNVATCWGTIRGRLDNGATFVKSGNTYKVESPNNTYAKLVKYGSTKTSATVSKVTFGEMSYNIDAIGSKAFYKKTKLKSVTFGPFVKTIGSKAFYGCKKLKTINCKKLNYPTSFKVSSKAFTKAYQKPTVKVKSSVAKTYIKKQLKKRGLKNAKYKVG